MKKERTQEIPKIAEVIEALGADPPKIAAFQKLADLRAEEAMTAVRRKVKVCSSTPQS